MKTYDIYAKQNGKWQRKGIQGEPTLPEYDGTVIIEKAESVLGLRRFKDTIDIVSLADENTDHQFRFSCQGTEYEQFYLDEDDNGLFLSYGYENPVYYNSSGWVNDDDKTINVLEPVYDFLEEWLLANTEGVSV
jgi:hypothetical protein